VGFEPTISAGERPQTYALDRAATGTAIEKEYMLKIMLEIRSQPLYRLRYPAHNNEEEEKMKKQNDDKEKETKERQRKGKKKKNKENN